MSVQKSISVASDNIEVWDEFTRAAAHADISTSALLLVLIRAYLKGEVTYVAGHLQPAAL